MKTKHLFYIIILTTLTFSCENLNEPLGEENHYSVTFSMETSHDKQKICIYRSPSLIEEIDWHNLLKYFVENAEITFSENSGLIYDFQLFKNSTLPDGQSYSEFDQPIYYVNSDELEIRSGKEYHLRIKIDETEIYGNSIVPGDFELLIPPRDTMKIDEFDGIEISWSNSNNAAYYVYGYFVAGPRTQNSDIYINFPKEVPNEGSYTKSLSGKLEINNDAYYCRDSVLVFVTAYDENTYNHLFCGHESAGLNNAYGFFGASVTKTAIIVIERD